MSTIAITGATSGIGLATAKILANRGHSIVFLVRNLDKAKEMTQDFPDKDKLIIIKCNLANLKSLENTAKQIKKEVSQLDVLINNAGGTFDKRLTTSEGIEMHLSVNHLGHFYLFQLLKDFFKEHNTKIINVSSEAHRAAKVDFNDLNLENSYSAIKGYGNVKLYNILFTKSLADRGFKSYALHPGVINSSFGDSLPTILNIMWNLGKPFMKSTKQGAETSVYLADNSISEDKNGSYFKDKKVTKPSKLAESKEAREKLWKASEEICERVLL